MKKMTVGSRTRTWRQINNMPELWECVPLKEQHMLNATRLALVGECYLQDKSIFVYEVGKEIGWEFQRKEAMKKAEKLI